MHRHADLFYCATIVVSVMYLTGGNSPTLASKSNASTKPNHTEGTIFVDGKPVSMKHDDARLLKKVQKLGVTVVFPTYLPQRFQLDSVHLAEEEPAHPDYVLEFHEKNKNEFVIESAYSGIGDGPDGDRTIKGNSKFFGPFTISVFKPGSEGNSTKTTYYVSSWMENKNPNKKQGEKANSREKRHYHFLGSGVTDKEAIDIVESLRPIE